MDTPGRRSFPAESPPRRVRRDRHGRGLRGPLMPQSLPGWRARADRFEDVVQDAVERLTDRCGSAVERARFRTAAIPDRLEHRLAQVQAWGAEAVDDPLGAMDRDQDGTAVISLFRRPLESRAPSDAVLAELVYTTVVEQWAALTGVAPKSVDPDILG